jgi:hypothetical protein
MFPPNDMTCMLIRDVIDMKLHGIVTKEYMLDRIIHYLEYN